MSKERQYKFSGKVRRCVYKSDNFSVYGIDVDKEKYPDIKRNKYGNVSITGNLADLSIDIEYEITAIETESKNGISYKVLNIKRDIPTSKEDVYLFLTEILTPNQAVTLYENYPDIIDRVKNDRLNDLDLSKLKGIGEKSFEKIKDKIIQNFVLIDLVAEFQGYLNLNIIKKIYSKYPSVEVLRKKLRQDPYKCLCGISRIGFKTADSLLLDMEKVSKENIKNGKRPILDLDCDLKSSPQRCLACVLYLLENNESNGNTKMNLVELRKQVINTVSDCIHHFPEVIKDKNIYYNKESLDIALKKTYNTEKYIAETILKYVNDNSDVWDYDIEKYRHVDGFDLSDEQMGALDKLCKYKISILNGSAGCVDCDTEFFDGTKWKRIADYEYGDKVLQYNEDGTAELVYPLNYIKQKQDMLYHFETKYGLNQTLSLNHNVYYMTQKDRNGNSKLQSKMFKDIVDKQNSYTGFDGRFITTFDYSGTGIDLTDDEIRLMVATFADGSFYPDGTKLINQSRFHIKKERKKERLLMLSNNTNRKCRIVNSAADGYNDFYIDVPFRAKHFPSEWYNCSKHQLQVIADEVMFWDGDYKRNNRYATNCKEDADFIQFVYSSLGYRATIDTRDRTEKEYLTNGNIYIRKSIEYIVSYTNRNLVSMCIDNRPDYTKTPITEYKTKDGYEYCFTVPSHILVLRRCDRIFITGNCGKSASTTSVLNMLKDNKKTFKLMSPTGKAAKIQREYTKEDASTIHRGLCYNPNPIFYKNGVESNSKNFNYVTHFEHNLYNKLSIDVLCIDEFSMCDANLFLSVLEAIDFTKTKLLLIGDNCQIPSVGISNLLHDFMESKVIPTTTLTKVHRYSDGGLMRVASDTRMSKIFLTKDMKNKATVFGNNKDYMFVDLSADEMTKNVVTLYKKLLNSGYTVNDIQILTAKNVGECGSIAINSIIQRVANPNYGSDLCLKYGDTTYYKNDMVIQTKNDYRAVVYNDNYLDEENKASIYNGDVGFVEKIEKDFMVVNFDGIRIKYTKDKLSNLNLSYSMSIHRSQGSSIRVVILLTPQSHTFMLNSNLIYTALTRMKERCYHLGSINTVNMCIKKKANTERHTFMKELLCNPITEK